MMEVYSLVNEYLLIATEIHTPRFTSPDLRRFMSMWSIASLNLAADASSQRVKTTDHVLKPRCPL